MDLAQAAWVDIAGMTIEFLERNATPGNARIKGND